MSMQSRNIYVLLFLFSMIVSPIIQAYDYVFSSKDIAIMKDNPNLEFVYLSKELRNMIVELAQADQEMDIQSALFDASMMIQEGFAVIPQGLADQVYGTLRTGINVTVEGLEVVGPSVLMGTVAEGYLTTAAGNYSHAEGNQTSAYGTASHSEGYATYTSGNYSHAEGYFSTATAQGAHAEGNTTHASGQYAHTEGGDTTASGQYSHAEGFLSVANALASHAEGDQTTASAEGAHAEGFTSTASGIGSHAEGNSVSLGSFSHAEGNQTLTSAQYAHSEGFHTQASGTPSHAEGGLTLASGNYSHAEGYVTTAEGYASHAEGGNTSANGAYSHAAGKHASANFANSYCWSDGNVFATSATNQFVVKATGTTGGAGHPGTGIIFNNGSIGVPAITSAQSALGNNATWSFVATNPSLWSGAPTTIADAINRLATYVYKGTPIS